MPRTIAAHVFSAFVILHIQVFASTFLFALSVLAGRGFVLPHLHALALFWVGAGFAFGVYAYQKWSPRSEWAKLAIFRAGIQWCLLAGLTLSVLYVADLHRFFAWNGGDGASHLALAKMFLATRIEENAGQVALSGFVGLFHLVFRMELHAAFVASYYFTLSAAVLFVSAVSVITSAKDTLFSWIARTFIWVCFCLPVLAYLQSDGFFWQYYGLNAWFLGFGLLAIARGNLQRAFAWGAACVLIRFTYGLNLPDAGVIFCFLALQIRGPLGRAGVVLGFASAVYGYSLILDLVHLGGGLREMDYFNNFGALLSLAILFSLLDRDGASEKPEKWMYWATSRLAGISAFFLGCSWIGAVPKSYYFLKYSMTPVLLCGLIVCGAVFPIKDFIDKSAGAIRIGVTTLFGLAVLCFFLSAENYRAPFMRNSATPSGESVVMSPLLDPQVAEIVERVGAATGKPFRLFITRSWPEYSFTNTYFTDFLAGGTLGFWGQTNFENFLRWTTLASSRGRGCVYWRGEKNSGLPSMGYRLDHLRTEVRDHIASIPVRKCEPARAVKNRVGEELICHFCE